MDLGKDQYGVGGGRLGIILQKQFAAIVGVWGVIAFQMEASQETCFLGKNNPSLLPDYQTVCS